MQTTTANTIKKTASKKPSGYILYEGASLIDGSPIVVIGTISSRNIKTGKMLQTWILRADIDPLTANRTGADYSICGNCPLKGEANPSKAKGTADNRGCYVQIGQAPASVYRTYKAGKYPKAIIYADLYFDPHIASTGGSCIAKGLMVRLGAYGDPAAVPRTVWDRLLKFSKGWTGYSHQSQAPSAEFTPDLCMVSADNENQALDSWRKGYRTFRIVADTQHVIKSMEVICPATNEGGNKATCSTCGLCTGTSKSAKSVVVVAHGAGKKHALSIAA